MICRDLQEPRRQSEHLDFALSQGWLTDLGQTHKPVGTRRNEKAPGFCNGERSHPRRSDRFRGDKTLCPNTNGLKITMNLDTYEQKVWMMRQPTTLNAEDQQLPEHTFRNKWKHASQEYERANLEARSSNQPRSKSEALSRAWRVITDTFVSSMLTNDPEAEVHAVRVQSSEVLSDHSEWPHQARKDWRSHTPGEAAPKLGKQDCLFQ